MRSASWTTLGIWAGLVACGGSDGPVLPGWRNTEGVGPSSGPGYQPTPVRSCDDGEVIFTGELIHHLAFDSQSYYWLGLDDSGITISALPKAGGAVRTVTSFPSAFAYALGQTTLPVSADAELYMSDLVADDLDDYLYFSGDTQIWRVKKDGSEAVQPVSGEGLNELGPATCNFARSVLRAGVLYTCRQGRVFRMNRSGEGRATVIYEAPEGSNVVGFGIVGDHLYTNGTFDEARQLAPLLDVTLGGGERRELGQMLEGLVPSSVYIIGNDLVFNSLFVPGFSLSDPEELQAASEIAERQGTYRVALGDGTLTKISDSDIGLAFQTGADSTGVYTLLGGSTILHIGLDGETRPLIDCNDRIGTDRELQYSDVWVDDDAVYLRSTDTFYRFAK